VVEKRFSVADEAFYRRLILPEEDQVEYRTAPPNRSYRWFRSNNVICLEHYKRPAETQSVPRSKVL
jgi:hypothetical protein